MKKRLLPVLLAISMVLLILSGVAFGYAEEYKGYTPQTQQQYTDVSPKHWAFKSIDVCSQRDWFSGYPDGTFKPENKIRRDEAAKVFAVALGLVVEKNPVISFTDTTGSWAKGFIEATKNLFPDTTTLAGTQSFRPEQTITREETIYALVVAWRHVSETTNADLSVLNMFSDKNSISDAIKPYVAVAVNKGLISGIPDGKGGSAIQGQTGLSRAEFATLLARALEQGIGKDETIAPKVNVDSYPSITPDASITIYGAIEGEYTSVTCDGKNISVGKDKKFSVILDLKEGFNSFTLKALNSYGNIGTDTISITRSSTKPSIRLLSTILSESTQSSLTANGVVNAWDENCTLLLDNSRVSVGSDGHFEIILTLKEGPNRFKLEVIQKGVTSASQTIEINGLTTSGVGEWVEKLPNGVTSSSYNIEQKNQYRSQTREVKISTESAMPGWTLVQADGRWDNWSAWQTTLVAASNTRKVETQSIRTGEGRTQYRYYAYSGYLTSAGAQLSGVTASAGQLWRHFSTQWMDSYTTNYTTVYTPWLDTPVYSDSGWRQVYGGQEAFKYRYDGVVYYHQETRATDPTYETQYRYQDFTGNNIFEKWSDWSNWTDSAPSAGNNTKVETKTVYRYTVK